MENKTKVEETIRDKKEKVEEDIRSEKEKVGKRMDKGKNVAEKVSNDFGKTVDDVIIGMKAIQKNLDSRFQEYKEAYPLKIDIDLVDAGDYYYLKAYVPGAAKEDVIVEATENSILLKCSFGSIMDDIEKPSDVKPELLIESRKPGNAQRTVKLPEKIIAEEISAKYNKGTLFLEIPKKAVSKTKVDIN